MDPMSAGEYVLGTLDDSGRRAIERAVAQDPALARDIRWWETRLAPLALALPPAAPSPRVWLKLQQAIAVESPIPARAVRLTRAWAALATAATMVLGFGLYREMSRPAPAPLLVTEPAGAVYVAVLAVPNSTLHWTVSLAPDRGQLAVRAGGQAPAAAARLDAELWIITDSGPVSLGVIPKTGGVRRALPEGLPYATGATLAVSLEPSGGSPTGKPTGPVVTTAQILQAG